MRLAGLRTFGVLLVFCVLPQTTANWGEGSPDWIKGTGPCSVTVRPAGRCGHGQEDDTCPYRLNLPSLTLHLPKQLQDLAMIVEEVQRLKEVVDELRRTCADCPGSQSERESARPVERERKKENEGKEKPEDERHWVKESFPERQNEKGRDENKELGADTVNDEKRTMEKESFGTENILEEREKNELGNGREKDKVVTGKKKKAEENKDAESPRQTESTKDKNILWERKTPVGSEERRQGDKVREKAVDKKENLRKKIVKEKSIKGHGEKAPEHQPENEKKMTSHDKSKEHGNDHHLRQDKNETQIDTKPPGEEVWGIEGARITDDQGLLGIWDTGKLQDRERKGGEGEPESSEKAEQSGGAERTENERAIREGDRERETGKQIMAESEKAAQGIQRDGDGELSSRKPTEMADIVLPTLTSTHDLVVKPDGSHGSDESLNFASPAPPISSLGTSTFTDTKGGRSAAIRPGTTVHSATESKTVERTSSLPPMPGTISSSKRLTIDGRVTTTATPGTVTPGSGPCRVSPCLNSNKAAGERSTSSEPKVQSGIGIHKPKGPKAIPDSKSAKIPGRPFPSTGTDNPTVYAGQIQDSSDPWISTTAVSPRTGGSAYDGLSSTAATNTAPSSQSLAPIASSMAPNLRQWSTTIKTNSKVQSATVTKPKPKPKPKPGLKSKSGSNSNHHKLPLPEKKTKDDHRPMPIGRSSPTDPNPISDKPSNGSKEHAVDEVHISAEKKVTHQNPVHTSQKPTSNKKPSNTKVVHSTQGPVIDQNTNPDGDLISNRKPKTHPKTNPAQRSNPSRDSIPDRKHEPVTSQTSKPVTEASLSDVAPNPLPDQDLESNATPDRVTKPARTPSPSPAHPKTETDQLSITGSDIPTPALDENHTDHQSPAGGDNHPDARRKPEEKMKPARFHRVPQPHPESILDQKPKPETNRNTTQRLPHRPWTSTKPTPDQRKTILKPKPTSKPKLRQGPSNGVFHSDIQDKTQTTLSPVSKITNPNPSQRNTGFATGTMKTLTVRPRTSTSIFPTAGPHPHLDGLVLGSTTGPTEPSDGDDAAMGSTSPNLKTNSVAVRNSNPQPKITPRQTATGDLKSRPTPRAPQSSPTITPWLRFSHSSATPATFDPDHSKAGLIPEPTTPSARELRVKINQVAAFQNNSLSPYVHSQDKLWQRRPKVGLQVNRGGGKANEADSRIPKLTPSKAAKAPRDCGDHLRRGVKQTGVYPVTPDPRNQTFPAFCEMELHGGGWTLVQRRQDGSVSFNRTWAEYRTGFGEMNGGEFWLGNEQIHLLTRARDMVLRVELEDFNGVREHAEYGHFRVASERQRYRLTVGNYSGSAGDALRYSRTYDHHNRAFTTPDRDNDRYPSGNCGAYYSSGWWFDACIAANLNGKYYFGKYKGVRDGIFWGTWHNISIEYYPTSDRQSFKNVKMMIRPKGFVP